MNNPVGIQGIAFLEYSTPEPEKMRALFARLGFTETFTQKGKKVALFQQNRINWLLNNEPGSFATRFSKDHGPCASAMGWAVEDAAKALKAAVANGARPCTEGDYFINGTPVPAIYGIGDSLIYFVDAKSTWANLGFEPTGTKMAPDRGFLFVDHLTNNVPMGTMGKWSSFYKDTFGFTEVRYFDIKGKKTDLQSFALRSPCGTFCIPINEAKDEKSQINEYLREYKGAGIQHIALATEDIVSSLREIRKQGLPMLDVDPSYYDTVFDRVPNVTEDKKELEELGILVDGDDEGYLLQIFTQNVIGPIFFEIIQRKNHQSFGEGNFGALFRSIERDQERRGVL